MATNSRTAFTPDEALPELGQAISLGLAILRTAKVTAWAELDNLIPYRVALYPGQLQLLRDHAAELHYIRNKGATAAGVEIDSVTLCICPDCGQWQQVTGSGAPSRCQLTIGCTGTPVRIAAAARASMPTEEDGRV